jgi:hypothetical protein
MPCCRNNDLLVSVSSAVRHLEDYVAAMADDPRADLDPLFPQAGQ